MKRLGILLAFLLALPLSANAATYYVRTDGNNACTGLADVGGSSGACAKRTIAAAAALTNAGDTVYVRSGAYAETLTLSRSGTAGSRITYDGTSQAAGTTKMTLTGSYITVNGFSFLTNTGSNSPIIYFNGGSYNIVQNSIIANQTGCDYGKVLFEGNYNTFTRNTIHDGDSDDVMRIWGTGNVVSYNDIHNWTHSNAACHTDFIQSFAPGGVVNTIVEGNIVKDFVGQMSNVTNDGNPSTRHDWIWRNNVFWNTEGSLWANIPGTKVYNNTFINAAYDQGVAVSIRNYGTDGNGCPNSEIKNNILVTGKTGFERTNCPTPLADSNNYTSATNPGWFVDFAGGNFHLTASATPVIGTGANLSTSGWDGGFTIDLDKNTRVVPWDRGAYGYNLSAGAPPVGTPILTVRNLIWWVLIPLTAFSSLILGVSSVLGWMARRVFDGRSRGMGGVGDLGGDEVLPPVRPASASGSPETPEYQSRGSAVDIANELADVPQNIPRQDQHSAMR
jgi:hypothetical protein